ncbi:MAG TPA: hypothetical protein VKV39_16065 [Candidatus Sulfotelmatobacter sp.]|nr:hypothetical protein [Candidatus Sulfotelmatobacter sp.]
MEGLTRLVSESLVRHGLDRPIDYRRLRWSRWFRCESHHSLLQVPSKPGVFALAEEITHVATAGGPEASDVRRMLAVTQFFEDDDMAFVLDRMLTIQNPFRDGLNAGRYFVRFVAIEDRVQRRSIHTSLTQWLSNSAERASGIGTHFAASLQDVPRTLVSDPAGITIKVNPKGTDSPRSPELPAALDSAVSANRDCTPPFPSGF